MSTTRRDFLKTGVMGAAVTVLAPSIGRAALATKPSRTLVILQLTGGNDAINTLIPYTDRRYRQLRPTLAIPEHEILPISETAGFHPAMAALVPLYEQKKLAIVNGVGFPTLDRSHFRCQDVWISADESVGRNDHQHPGWVGRYADLYLDDAHSRFSVLAYGQPVDTATIAKRKHATTISDFSGFARDVDPSLRAIYDIPRQNAAAELVRAHGRQLFSALDEAKGLSTRDVVTTYPATSLGANLHGVAQLLSANPAIRVVWVSMGGFDTHGHQAEEHTALLGDLSRSLAAFQSELALRGLADRTLVMGWSEFGRRIHENANGGTEHGKAGMVLLLGNRIGGGIYGDLPDLSRADDGDLPTTIDFRSVYATIIQQWLGHDPEPVLKGRYAQLGFVRK
jgi:uncharacterized protein (DUF1501 family)